MVNSQPTSQFRTQPVKKKKRVGLILLAVVGSLSALVISFFVGVDTGYGWGIEDASFDASESSTYVSASETAEGTAETKSAASNTKQRLIVLKEGDSVEVPCDSYPPTGENCMSIKLTSVEKAGECTSSYYEGATPVSLSLEVEVYDSTDSDFSSPFRSFPWSSSTTSDRMISISSTCDSRTYLDLMQVKPGFNATGTAVLPVTEDTNKIHFEANDVPVFIVEI